MANISFDFLTESFLFDSSLIGTYYSSIPEKELQLELGKYREHVIRNIGTINSEIQQGNNLTNVSIESLGSLPNDNVLKHLALYMDKVIIPDPVFWHTESKDHKNNPMSKLMKLNYTDEIDRARLASDIKYMKDRTSLVANQYVKYFPISLIHEPPKDLPLFYSKSNYSDVLPPQVYEFFWKKASVSNVSIVNGYMQYQENKPLEIGTRIHVGFDDEHVHNGLIYQYMESKTENYDPLTGRATFLQHIPETMSEAAFGTWVNQSINRAAIHTFEQTLNEILLSKQMNCMFLAKSKLTSDILKLSVIHDDLHSDLATLSMQLDLPVFDRLSLHDILRIRCTEGAAFHNFRTELNSKLLNLRVITDADKLQKELDNVAFELNETKVEEVKKEYRKIKKSLGFDLTMLTGSLITSFCTGGLTLIGAAGAIVKGTYDYLKYLSEVKENNGYFLWRINKQSQEVK